MWSQLKHGPHVPDYMQGFLQADTCLVMSVVRVRTGEGEEEAVFQVGDTCSHIWQDGRKDTNGTHIWMLALKNREKIDSVYVGELIAGEF